MKKNLIKFLTLLITSTLISNIVPNIPYINAFAETRENCNDKYKVNLTTLYPTEEDWNKDYNYAVNTLTPEVVNYKGKLNTPESFIEYIDAYNNLYGYLNKLYIYAYVQCDVDQSNSESNILLSKINSLIADTSLKLSFADAEIYQNDNSFFDNLLADPNYSSYKSVIEAYKEKRVHSLSEGENKILNKLSNTSEKPYETFTKLTSVDMEYPEVNGYIANESNYGIIRTSTDRKFRRDGSDAMFTTYGKYINTLASTLTTHMMNQNNIAQSLGYEDAFDKALKENNIPKEVYNNLIDTAVNTADKYAEYFNVNKELLGLKYMYRYDMAASPVTLDKSFTYEEGKKLVLDTLSILGTDYTDKLKKMIDESRIDVYSGANKVSGAYSISDSMAPSLIVMNYDDTYDSVSTLAHELGHSMYSTYSNENQPIQYAEPTIFTQEIASITNELILINNMIKNAETNEEKLYYLNAKLDLYNGTFFTQVQFAQFEKGAYDLIKEKGTLTPDDANKLWTDITKTYDGDVINTPDYYKYGWSRVPHFYYTFYVYKYATSLVCADIISEKLSNGDTEALAAYKNFLKSGCSEEPLELIKKAGVDLTNPDTFKNFSDHYGKLIEEYKSCAEN